MKNHWHRGPAIAVNYSIKFLYFNFMLTIITQRQQNKFKMRLTTYSGNNALYKGCEVPFLKEADFISKITTRTRVSLEENGLSRSGTQFSPGITHTKLVSEMEFNADQTAIQPFISKGNTSK
jgi:hypothetical protein